MKKPNIWWELVNTPRKAVCWAVLVVCLLAVIYVKTVHRDQTSVQQLIENWHIYVPILLATVGAYFAYPKD